VIELETDSTALFSPGFLVTGVTWQSGIPPEGNEMEVQIRYRSHAMPCRIETGAEGKLRVIPSEPLRAVTPGQAAVFYRGPVLLGGGVIADVD